MVTQQGMRSTACLLALSLTMTLLAACGTRVDDSTVAAGPTPIGTALPGEQQAVDADGTPTITDTAPDRPGASSSDGSAVAGAPTGGGSAAPAEGASAPGEARQDGGPASPASDLPPIQLGAVGTTTGIVGANGAPAWKSLRVWLQDVNERGGIAGRRVELTIVDDGGDPARNGAAVRQLIDEKEVVAFVGSYAPISLSGGLPAIEAAGLPVIGGDSAEAGWFTSPNAFPFNGQALPQGKALSQYGCEQLGERRLAIYYVQEIAFGKIIADQMEAGWKACGKEVVAKQGIGLVQPDFTSEVLQAQGRNAEAVAVFADPSGCRKYLASARRQGFKPVFFSAVSCYHPSLEADADMIGGRMYAGISTELPTADVPGMVAMRNAIARFAPGETNYVDGVLPLGYASGRLYEAAVVAAGGSTDPAKVLKALQDMRDVTLDGMIPPRTWGPGAHPEAPCAKIVGHDGETWVAKTPEFLC